MHAEFRAEDLVGSRLVYTSVKGLNSSYQRPVSLARPACPSWQADMGQPGYSGKNRGSSEGLLNQTEYQSFSAQPHFMFLASFTASVACASVQSSPYRVSPLLTVTNKFQ